MTKESAPKQEPPYGLRMPPDLKERVKTAAAKNNRSMNAEIVSTLEEKYPKPQLDLRIVANFLDGLAVGFTDDDDFEDRVAYLKALNLILSAMPNPYTIKEDMGAITFYPYRTDPSGLAKNDEEMERIIDALNKYFTAPLDEEDKKRLFEQLV